MEHLPLCKRKAWVEPPSDDLVKDKNILGNACVAHLAPLTLGLNSPALAEWPDCDPGGGSMLSKALECRWVGAAPRPQASELPCPFLPLDIAVGESMELFSFLFTLRG